MAISATLELRETPGSAASAVYGMLLKSYTVVDLDYTLIRNFDKTGRPCSGPSIDILKVTIRGVKEVTAKFHEWIQKPDKQMDGIIRIYDSTGYGTALSQDVTGGDTADYMSAVDQLVKREIEDNTNDAMDKKSKYREDESTDDIFNEMDHSALLNYIASKGLDVEVKKTDSDDTIRKKIRYANKVSKMTLEELKAETKGMTLPKNATREDYVNALMNKNNDDTENNKAQTPVYEMADSLKKGTTKTISSAASKVTKTVLESARSITFKNAYCVSLREHFRNDPDNKGTLNSNYPWLIEICIKPGKLEVNGWNFAGGSAKDVDFNFFTV